MEEAFKIILAGAKVNHKDNYGYTALILTASYGHKDIVQLLIGNDAK